MKKLVPVVLAACLAAPASAALAGGAAKKPEVSPSPAPQQTTRLGAPLKGVRMGRTFKEPARGFD